MSKVFERFMLNHVKLDCICDKCKYSTECGYFEDTMKPILRGAKSMRSGDTEFEVRILEDLNDFECEYYKERDEEE